MQRQGSFLVFCDDKSQAQTFAPAVAGTRADYPIASCSTAKSLGMADGSYFVGASAAQAKQVYCRNGVALTFRPDFSQIGGDPVAWWPFDDNSLADAIGNADWTKEAGTTTFTTGRVGGGLSFDGSTYFSAAVKEHIYHGPFTVVCAERR